MVEPPEANPNPKTSAEDLLSALVRRCLPWAGLLGLLVGAILMFSQLEPHKLRTGRNPSFLDNVFASRAVIWSTRMLLFVVAVYVVGSVVALIAQNKWLRGFGPLGVSEAFERVEERVGPAVEQVEKLVASNEALTKRLEEADRAMEELTIERDQLSEERDGLRRALQGG